MLSRSLATKFRRRGLVGLALVVVGCESALQPSGLSSSGIPPVTSPAPFVVSSPARGGSAVVAADAAQPIADLVFVSLPPRAIPHGSAATISVLSGGLTFTSLAAGDYHTCGVSIGGKAYCWGYDNSDQLGGGTTVDRYAPVAVSGNVSFARLVAGDSHTCGLTSDGTAYCWGANYVGQGGTPRSSNLVMSPVAVTGGLTFASLAAGGDHACGVTMGGVAYCWGLCQNVAGVVYCWGANDEGQAGNGTNAWPSTPSPVAGGFVFTGLSVGGLHACGFIVTGALYCRAGNDYGQLGDGSTQHRGVPTPVPLVVRGQ